MAEKYSKQKKNIFARYCFAGKSKTEAFKLTYPSSKKWKTKTINNRACEMGKDREVLGILKQLNADADKETIVTHNQIREELFKIAFFDIRRLYKKDGTLKDISELTEEEGKVISQIEMIDAKDDVVITKIKVNDKLRSIEKLAKHIGFYEMDNNQKNDLVIISTPKEFE